MQVFCVFPCVFGTPGHENLVLKLRCLFILRATSCVFDVKTVDPCLQPGQDGKGAHTCTPLICILSTSPVRQNIQER